ncbi:conjugal transfer protein TraB [Phyllobacterium endophyticum]|uniref:Conjugal transfer protein TraB n=1 Tax=Phyllobacterium endophyticum TaxID=1149773 RepID=A0A2P7AKF0_9HYPH|nr:conjugal transfer protein TraB [Phyllobacterium endophyticum]PSH54691.1 conjugal transfer protein TraB [Phyllobacterium endophyticum]TYR40542.1 conjugal transfer protein TraB [Phyllobacterium endophyticum]
MTPDILGLCRKQAFSVWRAPSLPSIPDLLYPVGLISGASIVGVLSWSGCVLALPLAMTFPTLWAFSRSRVTAVLVSTGYYLAASRGLPQAVASFYSSDLWPGLLLWIVASLAFVNVHAALWTDRPGTGRALRYGAAAVLMAIPPFGIAGWAHPITAAGVLFPGWGWVGFGVGAAGLIVMTTRWWPAAASALAGLWLWSAATWTGSGLPEGWRGIDLDQGKNLGRDTSLEQQRDLIATVKRAAGEGARVVVLPESSLGFWTPTVAQLWQGGLLGSNVTVIAGAATVDPDGYDNVLVSISAARARILYRERMPVPGSMWQPWRAWMGQAGGARAHLFENSVVDLSETRVAPLICYEQLLIWPVLHSMLYSPNMIVATGNGWWTSGTSIVAIQKASAVAWARLFNLPLVTAFNI